MSTVAAHVATSAVKNWMSAYVRSAKNVSAVHMIVSAKTDLRPNSLSRATGTVALIYHNIRCPNISGQVRRERGGYQVKQVTNHPRNRPDRDR
ncbi:hypothetical protein NMCA_44640 [Enterobacter ludwigii]|nr:hypothetical protein NMCA_44640 [Enterobacter ludwigii]